VVGCKKRRRQREICRRGPFAALKAEAAKFFMALVLLWLVLAAYQEVVVVGLIGSFVASILIFSIGLFAGDKT
jgi:F0F1-type ATP synthase assembly protein I